MPEPNVTIPDNEIIHDAFILGGQLVELKSRIQIARLDPDDFSMQIASIWRSIVNRITALQIKAFPDSSTENTLYNPPDRDGLPYLYPPSPDYGNIGIRGNDNSGVAILEKFKLYEVTRRAINCLTLLYMKEEESLIPDLVKMNKEHLVKAILAAAKDTGSGGGEIQSEENTSQIKDGGEEANSPEGMPQPGSLVEESIAILTERTVKFLEAWDGFLRENYYAGGLIPNDESELVAYEAGHSISLLSWGISLSTIPFENVESKTDPNLKTKLTDAWKIVFRDSAIIRLQHQVSALSNSLDNAYYDQNPNVKRPEENVVLVPPNPDLPSQAIQAVKRSIDYWQRTVKWIAELKDDSIFRGDSPYKTVTWSKQMRLALIEQANIWQTLMTGQQSLRAYNLESITHKLMEDVTKGVQESLRTNFKGSLHQAENAVKEIAGEVKEVISDVGATAIHGLEEMYQSYKRFLWPAIAIIVVVFLAVIFVTVKLGGGAGASGGAGVTLLTALLGYLGLGNIKGVRNARETAIKTGQEAANAKVESKTAAAENAQATKPEAGNSLIERIQGAGNEAGKMVLEAINKGYEQIQIELTGLSRSAAVAYPLIEFFTVTFTIKGDGDFLTSVIWSSKERGEELSRVLSAAFGPLALFITTPSEESSSTAS